MKTEAIRRTEKLIKFEKAARAYRKAIAEADELRRRWLVASVRAEDLGLPPPDVVDLHEAEEKIASTFRKVQRYL